MSFALTSSVSWSQLRQLESVIISMQIKLKTINEQLEKWNDITRMEYNIKSRDIYLGKIDAMVKQKKTIQSLLLNYRMKLRKLNSRGKMHMVEKQKTQPTKNSKLHELLNNSESQDTKPATKSVNTNEPSAKKQKTEIPKKSAIKSIKTNQVRINNHCDTMKSLRAHVIKRKLIEEENESDVEIVEEEQSSAINGPIMDIEVEQTVVADHHVGQQSTAPSTISIDSSSVAVQCLKALQEYAMLNENFRAIGLLMEAEKSFLCPAEGTDFEL